MEVRGLAFSGIKIVFQSLNKIYEKYVLASKRFQERTTFGDTRCAR